MDQTDQQKIMDAIAFMGLASDILIQLAAAPKLDLASSASYGAINVKLLDTLDECLKLLPVPKNFGQRQALDCIRDASHEFGEAKMCSRITLDLIGGQTLDFSAEEVKRTYYNFVRNESVSMIWRKFKQANQVIEHNRGSVRAARGIPQGL